MNAEVVIVTGGAGFLGSAVTVDLARDCRVVALDRRKPTDDLKRAAPDVRWEQGDVADAHAVDSVFAQAAASLGQVDFVVHLAAFYHFGTDWHPEYERTNLRGTSNVLQSAERSGVQRVIFASSVAAMLPPPPGEALTEKSPTADYIPYAKSKSIGERLLRERAARLPGVALRIGGAFSDWTELPPLSSLIERFSGRSPLARLMPGRGTSGMPYVHRDDVVRIVRSCIESDRSLGRHEVFLAAEHGAVLHNDLFSAIRRGDAGAQDAQPIFIPALLAKAGLCMSHAAGLLTRRTPMERTWMLRYVDRPWVVDTTYTREKLGFRSADAMGVLQRLPVLMERFRRDRRTWESRNRARNNRQYEYHGPES